MQHNTTYAAVAPIRPPQNQAQLFSLPLKPNNDDEAITVALVTNFTPLFECLMTCKGKDLLIVGNHCFKCNKTTKAKRYWRCDIEYCDIWVQTTVDGGYINMNKSEHDHFCDPDLIVTKKLIGLIRERCKQELLSIVTTYEQEVNKVKLTEARLCRMSRYDQLQPCLSRLRLSLLPPLPSGLDFVIPTKYTVAPVMFTQLVCIIACFEDEVVTTCYPLLDGKHTDGYRAIIGSLKAEAKRRKTVLMPTFIMTDFEGGLIKAVAVEVSS
ncbi:unnamed protein product [Rotaria sp. Silwood2]|nr:unnamed protein product [Rotaria sp. Silwood2]